MSRSIKKGAGPSVAKAGMNLLKKLVYDNYESPASDKRDSERQPVVGEVSVTVVAEGSEPALEMRAFVRDTSKMGCGLWSRLAMPIGRTVMIKGSGGEGKIERMGKVRHCRGASGTGFAVGIRFDGADGQGRGAR